MIKEVARFYNNRKYTSVWEVFRNGFDERYLRHALTLSQGNGLNISEPHAKERLTFIKSKLTRSLFGNNWRRKRKSRIEFIAFKHGDEKRFDAHYHAIMGIEGKHNWTDCQIGDRIIEIDQTFPYQQRYTKIVDVEYDWLMGNSMHAYVSRYAHRDPDSWFFI